MATGGLDKVLEAPPGELLADLKKLREEMVALARREHVILELLELIIRGGGSAAEEVVRLAGEAGVAVGNLRDQVRYAMAALLEANEYFVVPMNVHAELMRRGNNAANLDNVRVTMRRMAESDELLMPRPELGLYALPSVINNVEAMAALEQFRPET